MDNLNLKSRIFNKFRYFTEIKSRLATRSRYQPAIARPVRNNARRNIFTLRNHLVLPPPPPPPPPPPAKNLQPMTKRQTGLPNYQQLIPNRRVSLRGILTHVTSSSFSPLNSPGEDTESPLIRDARSVSLNRCALVTSLTILARAGLPECILAATRGSQNSAYVRGVQRTHNQLACAQLLSILARAFHTRCVLAPFLAGLQQREARKASFS